jgi:hypothetical protein
MNKRITNVKKAILAIYCLLMLITGMLIVPVDVEETVGSAEGVFRTYSTYKPMFLVENQTKNGDDYGYPNRNVFIFENINYKKILWTSVAITFIYIAIVYYSKNIGTERE